jgi:hypothetical protein
MFEPINFEVLLTGETRRQQMIDRTLVQKIKAATVAIGI